MNIISFQQPSIVRQTYQCPKCKRFWQWDGCYGQLILNNEIDKQFIKNIKLNLCYPCNFREVVEP